MDACCSAERRRRAPPPEGQLRPASDVPVGGLRGGVCAVHAELRGDSGDNGTARPGGGSALPPPLSEASDRDMLTDPSDPPTQFTHAQWCAARDDLRTLGEPYKQADDNWRQRLFRASLAMNQMQHHYGDLLSHVANHGGLFCERAVHVFLRVAPGGQQDSLNNRINKVEVRGPDGAVQLKATRQLRSHLHTLRMFRNRCDHDHLEDLRVSDKPELVHAAYQVALAILDNVQAPAPAAAAAAAAAAAPVAAAVAAPGPAPAAPSDTADSGWHEGCVITIAKHKRCAFIAPHGATRRDENLKVVNSVAGFAKLRAGEPVQYRIESAPSPGQASVSVVELAFAQQLALGTQPEAEPEPEPEPEPEAEAEVEAEAAAVSPPGSSATWHEGTVVKLVPEKFGFISPISGDKDVYVHSSVAGFQYLSAERGVGYRAAPNAKKPGTLQAVALRRPAVAEGVPPS